MTYGAEALIDLDALRHNLARVCEAAPESRVLAVVKADAYGHGMARAVRALADADGFAVARLDEALRLHDVGVDRPIVVLEGVTDAEQLGVASDKGFELVVHHPDQLDLLEQAPLPAPVRVWLKADTGMHRLGFDQGAVAEVWQRLQDCGSVAERPILMTHFADADDLDDPLTPRQWWRFQALAEKLGAQRSAANSGGILGWSETHGEWVRPGIMLYGVSPFQRHRGEVEHLRPVMTLRSRLIAVRTLLEGDAVGYGGAWTCPEDMPVGVVAIGYADGYPRHAPSGTPVLVNGQRVPLIGRVSMDMISVDLRSQPEVRIGDPAVLWGDGLAVEEIAAHADTIAYELLCGVGSRVSFIEVEARE